MFVVSKRSFKFRLPDGEYLLAKDYMGDVPEHIADHPLFKAAVKSGWIMTPQDHSDAAVYKADEVSALKEQESDIRSDVPKAESVAEKTPAKRKAKK